MFDIPNHEQGGVLLLNEGKVQILGVLNVEDFKADLHFIFAVTQRFTLVLEVVDLIKGFLVEVHFKFFSADEGSAALEVLSILSDFTLELVDLLFHRGLKVL